MKRRRFFLGMSAVLVSAAAAFAAVEKSDWREPSGSGAGSADRGEASDRPPAVPAIHPTLGWWQELESASAAQSDWRLAAVYSERIAALYRSENESERAAEQDVRTADYWHSAGGAPAARRDELTPAGKVEDALELYAGVPADRLADAAPGALYEPLAGSYIGMMSADRRVSFDFSKVESVYGKKHSMFLTYVGWRKVQSDTQSYFPIRVAKRAQEAGAALQIGWEPRFGLDDVKDDEYVRAFAREAKELGIPVFLRYASEMNGIWVPWHDKPEKYIEKFRLIHDIMQEEAPNVAMVWSPNFSPAGTIDAYYPGDDYVDWVGFSLYATPPNPDDPNGHLGPVDLFHPLYDKYAHKPIMISEGAVSHSDLKAGTSHPFWSEKQLAELVGYVPRIFPQVKALTYFNAGRRLSERTGSSHLFDLGESPLLDHMYQRIISDDHYLSRVEAAPSSAERLRYVPLDAALSGRLAGGELLAYVRLAPEKEPFAVGFSQNGRLLAKTYESPWTVRLDWTSLDRSLPLAVTVYDRGGNPLLEKTYPLPAE